MTDRIPAPICGLSRSHSFRGIPDFVTPWRPGTTLSLVTFTSSSAGSDELAVHALDEGPKMEQKWERKKEREERKREAECVHVQTFVCIDGIVHMHTRVRAHVCICYGSRERSTLPLRRCRAMRKRRKSTVREYVYLGRSIDLQNL